MWGLHCRMWAFSSCREQGLLSGCDHFCGRGAQALALLTSVAGAQGLVSCGLWTLEHTNLSSCCLWAPDWGFSKGDFPGGPVAKNPPYNAGDPGSVPGWGIKFLYSAGQLSLRAATPEPMLHN